MEEYCVNETTNKIYTCDQCEYIGSKWGLKSHKRDMHRGIKYPCDECEFVANFRSNLRRHKQAKHEGIRYPCDQCDHISATPFCLKQHWKAFHGDAIYQCDQCEFVAKLPKNLLQHKRRVHEGVTYPCDQCEYVSLDKGALHSHKQAKHEMLSYPCEFCDYTSPRPSHLKRHMVIHNNTRYPCEYCEFSASKRGQLSQHVRTVHTDIFLSRYSGGRVDPNLLTPEIKMEPGDQDPLSIKNIDDPEEAAPVALDKRDETLAVQIQQQQQAHNDFVHPVNLHLVKSEIKMEATDYVESGEKDPLGTGIYILRNPQNTKKGYKGKEMKK